MTMDVAASGHVDTFCRDHLPPRESWPELLFGRPELDYPARLNCGRELLDAVIERHGGDRRCLLAPGGVTWSYADLLGTVSQVAAVLTGELGIVPGNRVLLRGPNTPWLAACWLAVVRAGAVAVATMPLLRPGELSTVAEIARVDLALCDARFAADLLAADLGGAPAVMYGGGQPGDLTRRAAAAPEWFAPADTAADDVALLAFTSGTTGRPKATMHFHRDVLAIADTFSRHVVRPVADDLFTGTPPLAFTFGLGGLLVFPLRAGAATLLIEKASPPELADAIAAHQVTVCSTAPTAYRAMLAAGKAGQLARCGGRCRPASTCPRPPGTRSATPPGSRSSTASARPRCCTCSSRRPTRTSGPARPGRRCRATWPRCSTRPAAPVPDGVPGRLAVKGPTGCRYLGDARQAVYSQDGWNITGDTFVRDEDGYFWYQARSDDMIVSSGYNIAGPEVEEALMAHPAVAECCVVGRAG